MPFCKLEYLVVDGENVVTPNEIISPILTQNIIFFRQSSHLFLRTYLVSKFVARFEESRR